MNGDAVAVGAAVAEEVVGLAPGAVQTLGDIGVAGGRVGALENAIVGAVAVVVGGVGNVRRVGDKCDGEDCA